MSRIIVFLLLCSVFVATFAKSNEITVTLHVFSGTKDPEWILGSQSVLNLEELLSKVKDSHFERPSMLGYSGFTVRNGRMSAYIWNVPEIENFLLQSVPSGIISSRVSEHVLSAMKQRSPSNGGVMYITESDDDDCDSVPIRGPNTPPKYDPNSDDDGCFVNRQYDNNCYNYGNDIVTNTFAQPGRGSEHKWKVDTCVNVTAAAERDGLHFVGTDLPSKQPKIGHNVALLIWPETNFHWIRQDSDLYWSHKPGATPVKNTDNNGDKIFDPSKSDFSPWTQFCGYFTTIPSNVTIG